MRLILGATSSNLLDNAGCDFAVVDVGLERAKLMLGLVGELIGRRNKGSASLVEERHRDSSPVFCRANPGIEDMVRIRPHRVPPVKFPDGDCYLVTSGRVLPPEFVRKTQNTLLMVREDGVAWVTNPADRDHLWVVTHSVPLQILHYIGGV